MSEFENVIKEIINDERKLNVLTQIAFKTVDKDGSGRIEQPELEKIMAQICMDMGAEIPSKEDVQEVLDDLDEDGNNTIEVGEFKAFIKDILLGMIE
jgi:Ca2+-binding EF-hand superfamily protein